MRFVLRISRSSLALVALGLSLGAGSRAIADDRGAPPDTLPAAKTPADFQRYESGLPTRPPKNVELRAAPAPLHWTAYGPPRVVTISPQKRWELIPEECQHGAAIVDGRERPLRTTRIRIQDPSRKEGDRDVAILALLDNHTVALLSPKDPRLTAAVKVRNDLDDPWPSVATLDLLSLSRPIDLNDNDRNEVVLRRSTAAPVEDSESLVFVEPDSLGAPRFVENSEFLSHLVPDEVVITDITTPKGAAHPVLKGWHRGTAGCRFLAQVGVVGQPGCDDCCRLEMVFVRGKGRKWQPSFDRTEQQIALDRLRGDLEDVMQGRGSDELSSAQEAALGRAAMFFYLTGAAENTRPQLERALGARAQAYRPHLLLDRLERYFIGVLPLAARADSTAPADSAAAASKLPPSGGAADPAPPPPPR